MMKFHVKTNVSVLLALLMIITGTVSEEVIDIEDLFEEVSDIYEETHNPTGDTLNLHGDDLNIHIEHEENIVDPQGMDTDEVVDIEDLFEETLHIYEEALDPNRGALELHIEDLDQHIDIKEDLLDLHKVYGRSRLRCQKIDSLGSEEYSASYAVTDGSILALRLVPGYDRYITHNVNLYLWDHSQIKSPHAYISRIGLFNAWPWSLISYHRESEVSQDVELTSTPPMGRWMLMHVNIKNGQAEVILTAREGESYTITTPVPEGDLYLTAGRYNVLTPAFQVAWGCQVIEYSHTEL